jgi:beta-glucosidase
MPSLRPFAASALLLSGLSGLAAAQSTPPLYLDIHQPVEARVADLLSRMTLEEKIAQMQNGAPAIPRLGVPAYDWWNEALHGVARSGYATVFPQAIGLAATWDTELMGEVATTISTEARAKNAEALRRDNHSIYYGLTLWSPNINIFRDPRWGRGQETYGEDPYLTGRLAIAFIHGLQGDDANFLKTVATPKHFAVHSGPETSRHTLDVPVSPHDLEDTYLPAFRAAITEGHAASLMCAYNSVDGAPACANTALLQDRLRRDWHFNGFITSDCGAIGDFYATKGHHFSPDEPHAAAAGLNSGTDIDCGGEYAEALKAAVDQHLVTTQAIDHSLTRLFLARFKLGLFDPPESVAYARIPFSAVDSQANYDLALKTARESIVLLKNDAHTLPLGRNVRSIAVIGPNADSLAALEGNYNGTPSHPSLPLEAIQRAFPSAKITFTQGSPYAPRLLVQVPATVFHVAKDSAQSGLTGEYFATPDFTGKAAFTRIDPEINFDWRGGSPGAGLDQGAFAVRWTGYIAAPQAGDIPVNMGLAECFPCRDYESYTVFLDGMQIAHAETSEAKNHRFNDHSTFLMHFPDTLPHSLRVEYVHRAKLFGAGLIMNWIPDVDALRRQAIDVASKADVIVAMMGLTSDLEGEAMDVKVDGFDGGDRTKITLPAVQQALLDDLYKLHKPVVVVLMNGSALAIPSEQQNAAAIIEAWYPGEAGGEAIAETLAGRNNPAGRLPVTYYRSEAQLPPFDDYSMSDRTYRYFHGDPLYPFGFGLSYSTFAYTHLRLSVASLTAGAPVQVDVDVSNTSKIAGDEVAELYLQPPASPLNPLLTLQAFKRVTLQPGEMKHIRFELTERQLSTVDAAGLRSVAPGEYRIYVGSTLPKRSAKDGIALTITPAARPVILAP